MTSELSGDGLDFKTISRLEGNRYIPNLRRWLKHLGRGREIPRLYQTAEGRHIGWLHDDGWLYGSRLWPVLVSGGRAPKFAYPPGFVENEITGFWHDYISRGRCAIDPQHERGFIGDETRWLVEGDTRHCLWCHKCTQTLHKWTETVDRNQWRNEVLSDHERLGGTR